MTPEYVITLVHGTWAPEAPWTLEGSAFRNALDHNLQPAQVHFSNFNWSGTNDLGGRRQAAAPLLRHVRQLLRTYPKARHFVIAHSHGGNISFFALQRLQQRINGLVCLSTPFLHVRQRRFPQGTERAFLGGTGAWGAAAFLLCLHLLKVPNPAFLATTVGPFLYFMVVWTFVASLVSIALYRWLPSWRKRLSCAQRRFRLPDIDNDRVLIIRSAGDEATAALGTARLWSLSLSRMVALITNLSERDPVIWKGLLACLAGICLIVAGAWVTDETKREWPFIIGIVGGFVLLFGSLVYALLRGIAPAFSAPAFLLLALITRLAYGRGAALLAAGLEITAEATPPGEWSSVTVPSGEGLSHSSYESPVVCALVSDWIARRRHLIPNA